MSKDLPAPFRLISLERAGSTNDEARRLALEGAAADFLVVVAEEQTGGRGRRGRAWISPRGNLHCSLLVELGDRKLAEAAQLGFAAAAALVEALRVMVPGIPFAAKWPNDVLCEGRKVAGMLLEPAGDRWLVLGLGVNVVQAPPPAGLNHAACCLADVGYGGDWGTVLAAFCGRFGQWVARWREEGFAPLRAGWLALAKGQGEPILVRLEGETLTGLFAGLDGDGALLLDQGPAGTRRVLAGDVYFPGY